MYRTDQLTDVSTNRVNKGLSADLILKARGCGIGESSLEKTRAGLQKRTGQIAGEK